MPLFFIRHGNRTCYNKHMKILYVCTSTETGGAETALYAQALAAREAGNDVKIISLKPLGSVGEKIQTADLNVISFQMKGKFRLLEAAGVLARLVQEIQDFKPDVVHAFLYRAIQWCRLAKRRTEFRLITTPHYDLSRKNYFLRLLDRALKDADNISCAESYATAEFLKKKQKYPEEKIRLVTNGVRAEAFHPDKQRSVRERETLGFTPQDVVFLCGARLSAEKNHMFLLKSFASVSAKNPHVKLILAGDGPEKEKLAAFVREKRLENAVFMPGEVSDIYSFLLASDVAILVSSIESLPMFLLEACSCGLPAVVSKAGDMPRLVHHGENGFVCNGRDSVLLSALIAELAENKTLRQRMGQKSLERIHKYYPAPERIYLQIYQEIQ